MSQNIAKNKTSPLDLSVYVKSFLLLMKPRVMSLVLFTALVGLLVAPATIPFTTAWLSLVAVAIGSGAAGALNMWYESDVDAVMSRTCLRPIPTGKVKREQALWFGIVLSIVSIVMLYLSSNLISAILLSATIGFYFFIYTIWLKRKTAQNIVIGGAAGALPPVIGWSIATGSISIEPIIMFLIIFFWTPSHFWALSLYKSNDYKKAKIPMLPITAGIESTKFNILLYALFMLPVVAAPFFVGFGSIIYLILSLAMTIYYINLCYELFKTKAASKSNLIARRIFVYSIFYLFFLFFIILFDNLLKFNEKLGFEKITNSYNKSELSNNITAKNYNIKFNTNLDNSLRWTFYPEKNSLDLVPGEVRNVKFFIENRGNFESSGLATLNIKPASLNSYISKIGCFCYEKQSLKPKEKKEFLLTFFLDPKIKKNNKIKDISDIKLSFTFSKTN